MASSSDRGSGVVFDADCVRCQRLAAHLAQVRLDYPHYYARPVPSFGDPNAQLLVVGLAPGMHGGNRTGRPFIGDQSGALLFDTLYAFGYSNHPAALELSDDLVLHNCRIVNAVKCLPPQNRPSAEEVHHCNDYLSAEVSSVAAGGVVVALGRVAHEAVLRTHGLKNKTCRFAHAAVHQLPGRLSLVDSYHCSRYNTQTRRLTPDMFTQVFEISRCLLSSNGS